MLITNYIMVNDKTEPRINSEKQTEDELDQIFRERREQQAKIREVYLQNKSQDIVLQFKESVANKPTQTVFQYTVNETEFFYFNLMSLVLRRVDEKLAKYRVIAKHVVETDYGRIGYNNVYQYTFTLSIRDL